MRKIIKKIDWFIEKFSEIMSFCASLMILVVMVAVVADVLGRLIFNSPVVGVMEIVKMAIPIIAFFMFPWATHEFRHVRSTIFYGRMPMSTRIILDVIFYGMGALFFALIVRGSWPELLQAIKIGEFEGEGSLRVATWPTRLLIVVSSALVTWQMLRCLVMSIIDPQEEVPVE